MVSTYGKLPLTTTTLTQAIVTSTLLDEKSLFCFNISARVKCKICLDPVLSDHLPPLFFFPTE